MSISGRKRASKWDLKEEPQLFIGGLEYGTWPRKAGESVHNKESQPGSSDSEWYGIKSNNKDDRGYSDAMLAWHEDESYGAKMSPGLEDWRQRNSSRSPIISRGRSNRSQSRSPSYGSRKEPRLDGRSNAAKICGDVVAGRCRRGDHCPYLHQADREYEDMRSRDDMERENSRSKNALFELGRECEPQRSGDIPCKFFSVGNCRKGKYCRFSHHGQTANRNDRSRDDSKRHSGSLDTLEGHLRRSTSSVGAHDQRDEDRNGNIGAHEQRDADYTRDDRWVDSFNTEHRTFGHPIHNDEADRSKIERLQPTAETTAGMDGFESKGAENWFTDMEISSPWNSGLSSSHIVKEESGHISQMSQSLTINVPSLRTYEQNITREILGQEHQVTADTPSVISESAFLQSKSSSRENTGSSYALEARKATNNWPMPSIDPKFPVNVLLGQSLDQNVHSSSAVTHPLSIFNVVGQNQQLSQSTNLSVLSQLLGSVQQLPHLSSVSNPQNLTEFVSTSISNSSRQVSPLPASSTHPNLVMAFDRQYDPLSDSIDLVQHENDNQLPRLVPNPVEGKIVAGNDQYKTDNLVVELDQDCHQLDQPNPVANSNGEGSNGTKAEDGQKPQANKPLEKMNGDGGADEGKKKKDGKGIRAFKFALAEFVKEILKPKWKEGQISKDSHKAIVKKVVDKVTGSIQGAHIPQSQEKIDSYLSSSKPKLTKLVEAYVEKHQKS